jgi:hypothetical protein
MASMGQTKETNIITPTAPKPIRRKSIKKCREFPRITKKNHSVESDQNRRYNCIAYAAGVTHIKWWPIFHPDAFWPKDAPHSDGPSAFVKAFETLGYSLCENGKYEEGKEKIAFYASQGGVKHAARQVGRSLWASKLGDLEDIHHEISAVAGGLYGEPSFFMVRPKKD